MGKGTTATRKPTGAPRGTGPDEARRTTRGQEARQRGTPPATTKAHGQVPSSDGRQVPQTRGARTTRNDPQHTSRCQATANPHTTNASQEWRGAAKTRARAHTPTTHSPATSGRAQPKPEPKHTHPHRTPQPEVAGYNGSKHTSTHTPQHPSQEWRGAAETGAQAHTPKPHTPARRGGVKKEHAHQQTHTPTPELGVAGRSRNPSRNTHTHTAHPSQKWQGTTEASTRAHTHPNAPARSGGAQPKHEPKHTHPQGAPQPGVAGWKRSAHTSTHTAQHPSQEWRRAAET